MTREFLFDVFVDQLHLFPPFQIRCLFRYEFLLQIKCPFMFSRYICYLSAQITPI